MKQKKTDVDLWPLLKTFAIPIHPLHPWLNIALSFLASSASWW